MPIGDTRAWKILYLAPQVVETIVADIREGATADFEFTDPVIKKHAQVQVFEAAYDAMTGRFAEAGHAQQRLILLLAGLLHGKPSPSAPVPPELARAKARIDDDPAAPITLAELACEAGQSRFQVVRGFTRITGLTPNAYIVQRRLDAARAMIAASGTQANAAADCGFAEQRVRVNSSFQAGTHVRHADERR